MRNRISETRQDNTYHLTFITSDGNFTETVEVNSVNRAKTRAASIARKLWHEYCNIVITWTFDKREYCLVRSANEWGKVTQGKADTTPDIQPYESVEITDATDDSCYNNDIIGTRGYFTSCRKNIKTGSISGCFITEQGKGKLDNSCFKNVIFRAVRAKRY